jgi:hypothetical protein
VLGQTVDAITSILRHVSSRLRGSRQPDPYGSSSEWRTFQCGLLRDDAKEKKLMTRRTTRKAVTFRRPFTLSGIDGTLPPDVYDVDTDEESLDSLSILGYRRIATFIQVHRDGNTQVFPIDPLELDAALARDGGQTVVSPTAGR